jgi:hypothetical protein
MVLECHIENRGRKLLKAAGCVTKKEGQDGWPDVIVFYAPRRHYWLEFKQPDGSLTVAQVQRIPKMRRSGESVYVIDTAADVLATLAQERAKP